MRVFVFLLGALLICACQTQERRQAVAGKLTKVSLASADQAAQLRNQNVEVIVAEPDYAIVRTADVTTLAAYEVLELREEDMIQRLVHIEAPDSTTVQRVVDSGVDVWEIQDGRIIGQAFDIHIVNLRDDGLTVTIVAQNARTAAEARK